MPIGDMLSIGIDGFWTTDAGGVVSPDESDVRDGVLFGVGGTELEGNIQLPAVANVRENIGYGSNGTEKIGTLDITAYHTGHATLLPPH